MWLTVDETEKRGVGQTEESIPLVITRLGACILVWLMWRLTVYRSGVYKALTVQVPTDQHPTERMLLQYGC